MRRTMQAMISVCAVCFLGMLAAACTRAQAPHTPSGKVETVWSGTSSRYHWRWTTADLFATDLSSRRVFSVAAREKEARNKEDAGDPIENFYIECTIQPLSIVGTIVSYERDYYWSGGAHPSGGIDFVSVDVTRPKHRLTLTDLFPDSVVLNALLKDKVVQETIKRNKLTKRPKTCAALVNFLKDKTFGGDENADFGFTENLLEQFAFHHVENGKVAVRLNVSWASEIHRFSTTQIGLLLPIPAKLSGPISLAGNRKQGFLMHESKKLAHDKTTLIFTAGRNP